MTKTDDWIVHPNRFAPGPDKVGQNGHYRRLKGDRTYLPEETCRARITLPAKLAHLADDDGTVTFSGHNWLFTLGVARDFSVQHINTDAPLPFGFKKGNTWHWWDGTTSDTSILDASDAEVYIREYLVKLFPGRTIEITDLR